MRLVHAPALSALLPSGANLGWRFTIHVLFLLPSVRACIESARVLYSLTPARISFSVNRLMTYTKYCKVVLYCTCSVMVPH